MRKAVVLLVGLPVLAIGIILVPLPGPGLLICFLALMILSLEFDAAQPYLERARGEFRKIWDRTKAEYEKLQQRDDNKPAA